MMMKTINTTLGVMVALSVWCAVAMLALFVAVIALHVLLIGGFTIYHLIHS